VKRVGRELGVRYVLEGSVRRGGHRVRVTAQLIDAESGNHVWAERYDRDLADVFAVQDEITLAVTRATAPAIADAERRRALRKPPESLGAWEAYQRGLWHVSQNRLEDVPHARSYLNRALELDPTLTAAHTGLAVLYHNESGFFAKRPIQEGLRLAAEEARKAVELDPNDAAAYAYQALAIGMAGDCARGLDYVERALSINLNCVRAHGVKGWLLLNSDRPAESRESILFAMRLDPRSTLNVLSLSHIVQSYYLERTTRMRWPPPDAWWQIAPTTPGRIVGWLPRLANSAGPTKPARRSRRPSSLHRMRSTCTCDSACPGCGRSTTTTCSRGSARPGGKNDPIEDTAASLSREEHLRHAIVKCQDSTPSARSGTRIPPPSLG
jgi:tetratricopeptide (TPR) repeat protein